MRAGTIATMCGVALLWIGAPSGAVEDELAGSAFIGRGPTAEEEAQDVAQVAAAELYVECLRTESDVWFGKPDLSACDAARTAYAMHLAAEFADNAIGCLEETVIGSARAAGETCVKLRERLPDPFVVSRTAGVAP